MSMMPVQNARQLIAQVSLAWANTAMRAFLNLWTNLYRLHVAIRDACPTGCGANHTSRHVVVFSQGLVAGMSDDNSSLDGGVRLRHWVGSHMFGSPWCDAAWGCLFLPILVLRPRLQDEGVLNFSVVYRTARFSDCACARILLALWARTWPPAAFGIWLFHKL